MAGVHIKAVYSRTRVAGAEDVAVTTHDLAFGSGDERPTEAQMDTLAAKYVDFWGDLNEAGMTLISNNVSLVELRFYIGYDGDGSPGEVDYVKTYSLPGSEAATKMCPPQIACTVTELTDSRKHWGRFYIPGISTAALADDGTLTSGNVGFVAAAAETLYEAWGGITDVTPIVWSRSSHPIEYLGLAPPRWRPSWIYPSGTTWDAPVALSVQAIRVDEILDVQRRRRWQSTQIRNTKQLA